LLQAEQLDAYAHVCRIEHGLERIKGTGFRASCAPAPPRKQHLTAHLPQGLRAPGLNFGADSEVGLGLAPESTPPHRAASAVFVGLATPVRFKGVGNANRYMSLWGQKCPPSMAGTKDDH